MNVHNYNHLFYFYVTVKLGGVSPAARYLNTSQSSLSTQLKTLEAHLGKRLFQKAGRNIKPTDAGSELYQYCRRSFENFDEMFANLGSPHAHFGNVVSIGVDPDSGRDFITEVISEILRKMNSEGKISINLVAENATTVLQLLQMGEIDFCLSTRASIDQDTSLIEEFYFPMALYLGPKMFEKVKGMSAEEIINRGDIPLALPSRSSTIRSEIEAYLTQEGLHSHCIFESNMISALKKSAVQELCSVFLPRAFVIDDLQRDLLVEIPLKKSWDHRVSMLATSGAISETKSKFAKLLIEEIHTSCSNAKHIQGDLNNRHIDV